MKRIVPDNATHVFMLGIGGAGMSALAKYFHAQGKTVGGYDRSHTSITHQLSQLGMKIIYHDRPSDIPPEFLNPDEVLVIYTPAIKEQNQCFTFFRREEFTIMKRAEVLGMVSRNFRTLAVAGTHGKTTTSAMLSHLLQQTPSGCNALIGGIMKNYQTNCLISASSDILVTEADEYDRSFLQLAPYMAIITACDADHLDIYGNHEELRKAFIQFAASVPSEGLLVIKKDILPDWPGVKVRRVYTYSANDPVADVHALHVEVDQNAIVFDLRLPGAVIRQLRMPPVGWFSVENAVAASFVALQAGIQEKDLREGLRTFAGVRRRFDLLYRDDSMVYIDDYAHHPREIDALIQSVRVMFPSKKVTGIFQPHLFTRTQDLADEFASSLSQLDEVILLDIYPAREEPISGVNSAMLLEKITRSPKILLAKEEVPYYLLHHDFEVLLTIGAGDIDTLVEPILMMIRRKTSKTEIP